MTAFTVWDSFVRNADLQGDKTAFDFGSSRLQHRELMTKGLHYAGCLRRAGVNPGDRVAIVANSRPEFFILLSAVARLGAILVPINWRLSAKEILDIHVDCEPALVFVEAQYRQSIPPCHKIVELEDTGKPESPSMSDFLQAESMTDGDTYVDAPLLLLYTASVDGAPRGATLSHGNLIASSVQMQIALGLQPRDAYLGNLPFFHMMAIALSLAVNFAGGRTVVRPRFDAAEAAVLIESEKISFIGTFPPMLASVLDSSEAHGSDISSLRYCMGLDGAANIERFEAVCTAAHFWSIYGQTEAGGNVTYSRWRDMPGSAGRAAALSRLKIVDENDDELPPGRIGEIVVRGPGVFKGYWRRQDENERISRNGWHHTGDLGRLDDDHFLWYASRAPHKELIKSGGENIYPGEIEQILREHPSVHRAVVFGVPDTVWGESVLAVCEVHANAEPDPIVLQELVGNRLARYKRPKRFVFVPVLPEIDGRVDRAKVKELYG